jgi:hypothetical protein
MAPLGADAQFRGYLWASRSGGRWSGEINGQLLDVDLGQAAGTCLPHTIDAQADVAIEAARFRDGRITEAMGTLTAGPGRISRGLLEAAVAELSLIQHAQPSTAGDLIAFEQLGVAWHVGADGLSLQGRCPTAGPGTILVDRRQRLLGEPIAQPQPIASLVRTLAPGPPDDGLVPATPAANWLLAHLPATTGNDATGNDATARDDMASHSVGQ